MPPTIPSTTYGLTEGMLQDLQVLATQDPNQSDLNAMLQVIRTSSTLAKSILALPAISLPTIQKQITALTKQHQELMHTNDELVRERDHWKTEAEAYSQRAAALEVDLTREKANLDYFRTFTTITSRPRIESIPDPEMFDGRKEKLRSFIAHLRLKIQGDQHKFPDTQHQLRYASGRLSGVAFDQVLPFIKDSKIELDNLESFITLLENAFGDPDRVATAERKLETLKQKNQDFASYYAEFQRYIADVDWNDGAKRSQLTRGLSNELKDQLVTVDAPTALHDYVALLQRLDNRIRARAAERTNRSLPPRQNSILPRNTTITSIPVTNHGTRSNTIAPISSPHQLPPPSTQSGTHSGPMDLSSMRRRLTTEEKTQRIREGRCLYCGGFGHMALSCPAKAAPRTLRAHETILNLAPFPPTPNLQNNNPYSRISENQEPAENELSQA